MEKAREGQLKVNMEHQGLNRIGRKHEQISNRITMAIILASITLGSSILVLAEVPPLWHDIPVIGLVGFLGATILGFWLLASDFHTEKWKNVAVRFIISTSGCLR